MRPDSSMSLLSDIASEAMDPEYLTTVAPRRNSRARFLALFLVAALLSVAMASTTRSRNEVADERNDLLSRIAAERQRRDELTARVGELGSENGRLRQESVADPSLRAELQRLETVTGAVAVSGPGIQIQVNDAEKAVNGRGVIYDSDLTRLVNGLWQSGAEAMAINGQRITTLTPIRSAGSAITVDYVSLNPPYSVDAIGDPTRMQTRFAQTPAAAWWQHLHDNYGISYELKQPGDDLQLPADPAISLRYAES
ncbi:DUF881 domain-containing protein [Arachnia rubra]|uniref:DUF881 domain-containing protein n=1 Tax=Arachnia rubra TaxID=1547448 RepID=A0ABX7Y1L5_9ACTN|nr:DUF881 domain-containing protein [Arachnia rubra]MBB1571263.1 DUF881 domain-containing protein [Propionibacterium sp.]MDO4644353.1 DUF881 domain-containing protein [Propionibacteriaceae bacterium]MBB1577818.1 DUF881 domain-containing protein [Propionibacterium sp.]QUC06861.1 DUF881 domain-containing protein [Arachnia rubra]BCR81066.1 membrane protein [Arachnia rubra]